MSWTRGIAADALLRGVSESWRALRKSADKDAVASRLRLQAQARASASAINGKGFVAFGLCLQDPIQTGQL